MEQFDVISKKDTNKPLAKPLHKKPLHHPSISNAPTPQSSLTATNLPSSFKASSLNLQSYFAKKENFDKKENEFETSSLKSSSRNNSQSENGSYFAVDSPFDALGNDLDDLLVESTKNDE